MGRYELTVSRALSLTAMMATVAMAVGCATVDDSPGWPEVDIEAEAPAGDEEEPRIVRGDDGLLYAVGAFDETPQTGDTVYGRYADEWPLDEMAPPALLSGNVVESLDEGVVRIHPNYKFPETNVEELDVDIVADRDPAETMGKGLGTILDIDYTGPAYLELSVGGEDGVQEGDMYGVLRSIDPDSSPDDVQMTRRLLGICMVVGIDADKSDCRLWQGHADYRWAGRIEAGQDVTFLEPTFGQQPREATVLVSEVDDDEIQEWIVEHLEHYFDRFPRGNVNVEVYDDEVTADDPDFHRWRRKLQRDEPAMLVGVDVTGDDGDETLRLNYTGLGTATGPGLVAAPPEGGVDMGRVEDVETADWRGFSSMLMGAVMVYRGQTSEALMHLNEALRDPGLSGKWRWHARDQYAMRWTGLDREEEALWLVREDMAVARNADDDHAYYNALGTLVRLHDAVDQHQRALETADEYLEWRLDDKPSSGYLAALMQRAEMAVQTDRIDETREAVDELLETCPDGCEGDAIALLAGVYWAATNISPELQDDIVAAMVDFGEIGEMNSMASARMFQGWTFLRDEDLEQALIAFLEAKRLFDEREKSRYGSARAQFYIALTQVGREESQQAYEHAMETLEYMREIGDYRSTIRLYERIGDIYVDIDTDRPPEQFLGAATSLLEAGVRSQLAAGDYGRAAEAGFGYGNHLFRLGNADQARAVLQRSVTRGLRVAQFDIVAICHLFLAIIARAENDMTTFEQELGRAEMMAAIADDPYIDELLEELQAPPEERPDDEDPTQLL